MRVILMGCGRVGEQLARLMADDGHDVAVIDQDPAALARLGPGFKGRKVKGVGFDRDVLLQAGIERADAFAATSASDNANIVAARIARTVFHVPRVVARVYDPRTAEIYRRLGMLTISSTTWGAERFHELLTHAELDWVQSFGQGEVALVVTEAPERLVGRTVMQVSVPGEISVVVITRQGRAFIPALGTEILAGDQIHLVILASAMERAEGLLGLGSFGGG